MRERSHQPFAWQALCCLIGVGLLVATACELPHLALPQEGSEGVEPTASVGVVTFRLEVASAFSELERGLSGRASLAEDEGMLFVFPEMSRPSFWMRGMEFALDILWISSNGIIVDVTHQALPGISTPEASLPLYQPRMPITYVLEINGGLARRYSISVGDHVSLKNIPLYSASVSAGP